MKRAGFLVCDRALYTFLEVINTSTPCISPHYLFRAIHAAAAIHPPPPLPVHRPLIMSLISIARLPLISRDG